MPRNSKKRLCIFSPLNNVYSETFIKHHIDRLPFEKMVVNGPTLIDVSISGKKLYRNNIINRVINKVFNDRVKKTERKLKRAIMDFAPSMVLFEYGHIGAVFYKYCVELDIPFIVHFHGNDASHKPTIDLYGKTYVDMFENAKAIVAVSLSMCQRLYMLGAPQKKLHYIPYGVDLKFFKPNKEEKLEDSRSLICVGRFVEKKAPYLTIIAFKNIADKFTDVKLQLVGNGPLLDTCKQMVKAFSLQERVMFLGVKTPDEISRLLNSSYLFLQHSVIDNDGGAEGTPNSILEASASGLPVISTIHEGIPDVIIDGETGLLVEELDVDGMSSAIEDLLSNDYKRNQMGIAGRKRIEKHFCLDQQIAKLGTLIFKCINPID